MALSAEQLAVLRSKTLPKSPVTGEVYFEEPWQARIYCLVMALSHAGCCDWNEWVNEYFSVEVEKAMRDESDGRTPKPYYQQWLDAAERMVAEKDLGSSERLFAKRLGAIQPAPATQHGKRAKLS